MNILPKKRWHVRTRENITRVRRDEAAAAEEEKKRVEKIELAEKEARTALLKSKARALYGCNSSANDKEEPTVKEKPPAPANVGHVNLFYELEEKSIVSDKTNKDHEREKIEEKEKYEKQIGYLTYLGQDTNELTGNVSWYNRNPDRDSTKEIHLKEKRREDPLDTMKKGIAAEKKQCEQLIPFKNTCLEKRKEKHKDKKRKKSKKHKEKKHKKRKISPTKDNEELVVRRNVDLDKLREERLKREQAERARANAVIAKLKKANEPSPAAPLRPPTPEINQKYNSQFNPHLARQNF